MSFISLFACVSSSNLSTKNKIFLTLYNLKNILIIAEEVVVFPVPVAISNKNLSLPFFILFCIALIALS